MAVDGLAFGVEMVLWLEEVPLTLAVDVAAELDMLVALGVLVLVEHPAQAAATPTTAAIDSPSRAAQARFIVGPLVDIELTAKRQDVLAAERHVP